MSDIALLDRLRRIEQRIRVLELAHEHKFAVGGITFVECDICGNSWRVVNPWEDGQLHHLPTCPFAEA